MDNPTKCTKQTAQLLLMVFLSKYINSPLENILAHRASEGQRRHQMCPQIFVPTTWSTFTSAK